MNADEIADLVNRLEGSITSARDFGGEVLRRFGGRPFTSADRMLLTM